MLNFDLLKKDLEIVSLPYFVHDFSRKMFHMLYTLLANQISLPDCLYFGKYVYCNCDVMNLEIKLIFLIKPLFYTTKNSRQKFKYLENAKRF